MSAKVKYLPLQPHCFAFGGFEIQMLSTLSAVQETGVVAEKLDVWSKDKDFDILHVWGLDQAQYNTVYWAKQSGKKVIVTALLPYMETRYQKIRHQLFTRIGNEKYMRKIVTLIDGLVLVNDIQRNVAIDYFLSPPDKTFEIPNIVEKTFFSFQAGKFSEKYGIDNYVLCVGNVCERKNQLKLVKACVQNGISLVLIGHVLAGEEALGVEIETIVRNNTNVIWIKGLAPQSPDLVSAFFDCSMFALPSYVEQQPISALEAAAAGKPLLLADRAYAKQQYYNNCSLVDPDSVQSISEGIQSVFKNRAAFLVPQAQIEKCEASRVGNQYKEVYERVERTG